MVGILGTVAAGPARMADPVAPEIPAAAAIGSHARETDGRLRLRAISCEVFARPVYRCAARSAHIVDVTMLRQRLHDTPVALRELLQAEIDLASEVRPRYDAVVLAYGLCGGASAGIVARDLPVVVPRAHDCITVMLGSRDRYAQEFGAHPGTYWFSADYLERSDDGEADVARGLLGVGATSTGQDAATLAEYSARFGEDNAEYLMEVLGNWRAHYDRSVFLGMGTLDAAGVEGRVRRMAEERGWVFERRAGSLILIRRLLDGDWDNDFLVLAPGQRLAMSYDASVLRAVENVDDRASGNGTEPT